MSHWNDERSDGISALGPLRTAAQHCSLLLMWGNGCCISRPFFTVIYMLLWYRKTASFTTYRLATAANRDVVGL